ncbi:MAG: serine aminopeptidase domain-containing protein [Gammaproteobacteria bacterium]
MQTFIVKPSIIKHTKIVVPGDKSISHRAVMLASIADGNTKIEKRLPLIQAPTLLLWGEQDRVMPRSYADRMASLIGGTATIKTIAGAGHLAELDQPQATAHAVLEFMA